LYVEAGL